MTCEVCGTEAEVITAHSIVLLPPVLARDGNYYVCREVRGGSHARCHGHKHEPLLLESDEYKQWKAEAEEGLSKTETYDAMFKQLKKLQPLEFDINKFFPEP